MPLVMSVELHAAAANVLAALEVLEVLGHWAAVAAALDVVVLGHWAALAAALEGVAAALEGVAARASASAAVLLARRLARCEEYTRGNHIFLFTPPRQGVRWDSARWDGVGVKHQAWTIRCRFHGGATSSISWASHWAWRPWQPQVAATMHRWLPRVSCHD